MEYPLADFTTDPTRKTAMTAGDAYLYTDRAANMRPVCVARSVVCILGLVLAHCFAAAAQNIELSAGPDTTVYPGEPFWVRVNVNELLPSDSVTAYQLALVYPPELIDFTGAHAGGELPFGMRTVGRDSTAGVLRVAATSANIVHGAGVLFYAEARALETIQIELDSTDSITIPEGEEFSMGFSASGPEIEVAITPLPDLPYYFNEWRVPPRPVVTHNAIIMIEPDLDEIAFTFSIYPLDEFSGQAYLETDGNSGTFFWTPPSGTVDEGEARTYTVTFYANKHGEQGVSKSADIVVESSISSIIEEYDVSGYSVPSLSASPNPFNAQVRFVLSGAEDGLWNGRMVNAAGQTVRRWNMVASGGESRWVWDGRDERNAPVSSGIYFGIIERGPEHVLVRVTLIR